VSAVSLASEASIGLIQFTSALLTAFSDPVVGQSIAWRPAMARISWMLWWHMMKRKNNLKTTQPRARSAKRVGVIRPKIDRGQ